jgi:hypothetical protein
MVSNDIKLPLPCPQIKDYEVDIGGHWRTFYGHFDEKRLFRKKNRPFLHFFRGYFLKAYILFNKSTVMTQSPDKERTPGKWTENEEAISHTFGAPLVHLSYTFRTICSAKGVQKLCEMFAKSGNYRIIIHSAS